MQKNTVKTFFSGLLDRIKRIDKKWIPAIVLGTVAIIAAICVGIAALTPDREDEVNSAGGNTGGTDVNGQYTMPTGANGQGGEGTSYTPEQVKDALSALGDALKNNSNKFQFNWPTSNRKPGTTVKSTKPATTGSATEKPNTTKPTQGTTAPSTTKEESTAPATTAAPEPPPVQNEGA